MKKLLVLAISTLQIQKTFPAALLRTVSIALSNYVFTVVYAFKFAMGQPKALKITFLVALVPGSLQQHTTIRLRFLVCKNIVPGI